MLFHLSKKTLFRISVMTFCLSFASQIPFLNIPVTLLTIPLFYLVPAMGHSSYLVEWWFLGFIPKNPYAWMILAAYYVILSCFIYFIISSLWARFSKKSNGG